MIKTKECRLSSGQMSCGKCQESHSATVYCAAVYCAAAAQATFGHRKMFPTGGRLTVSQLYKSRFPEDKLLKLARTCQNQRVQTQFRPNILRPNLQHLAWKDWYTELSTMQPYLKQPTCTEEGCFPQAEASLQIGRIFCVKAWPQRSLAPQLFALEATTHQLAVQMEISRR